MHPDEVSRFFLHTRDAVACVRLVADGDLEPLLTRSSSCRPVVVVVVGRDIHKGTDGRRRVQRRQPPPRAGKRVEDHKVHGQGRPVMVRHFAHQDEAPRVAHQLAAAVVAVVGEPAQGSGEGVQRQPVHLVAHLQLG